MTDPTGYDCNPLDSGTTFADLYELKEDYGHISEDPDEDDDEEEDDDAEESEVPEESDNESDELPDLVDMDVD